MKNLTKKLLVILTIAGTSSQMIEARIVRDTAHGAGEVAVGAADVATLGIFSRRNNDDDYNRNYKDDYNDDRKNYKNYKNKNTKANRSDNRKSKKNYSRNSDLK